MSSDVLRGDTAHSLVEGGLIVHLFFGGKLSLRMREEIGAIAVEREHQEQLGVQSWRGNATRGKAVDSRGQGFS